MKNIIRNTNRSHRSAPRARRAARVRISLIWACALRVLLGWVGVWHTVVPWKSASDGVAVAKLLIVDENSGGGGEPNPDPVYFPDAQPGAPSPWESSTTISTYSTDNMLNRNVQTVIRLDKGSEEADRVCAKVHFEKCRGMSPGQGKTFYLQLIGDDKTGLRLEQMDD